MLNTKTYVKIGIICLLVVISNGRYSRASDIVSPIPVVSGPLSFPTIPGAVAKAAFGSNLAIGDTDLYTCPAGKKAYAYSASLYNASAGNITWFFEFKSGGTYYRMNNNTTTATNVVGTALIDPIVLDAGESISINTATTVGMNAWYSVIEFPASHPFKSIKKLSFAVGDNLFYTVPAGSNAITFTSSSTVGAFSPPQITFSNTSGGTRTIKANAVPSGGTIGVTNQITINALSVGSNITSGINVPGSMASGDFININDDAATATQAAWMNVFEIPN